MSTGPVLFEVGLERARQDVKWGEQNHPDGTGPYGTWTFVDNLHGGVVVRQPPRSFSQIVDWARRRCDQMHAKGKGTWEQILSEEVFEAFTEADPARLRAELIQVAAVAVGWIEAIDRRPA